MHPAAQRTFTLTRKELLLRGDKYEPHNLRQFDNEQSIDAARNFESIRGIVALCKHGKYC